jgi:hypothetical protein
MARSRKMQRGGNLGHTYSLGGPLTPQHPIGNTAVVIPSSSCMANPRFGEVSFPTTGLGLPGMNGGSRRKQRGGRYSFDLSAPLNPAAPWAGGIPPVMRIPCESALTTVNPLNKVQMGGVGGPDSAFYAAKTAGYTNTPSTWLGSTGAPSLLQTPYDARTTPPVCMKTGGGRRGRRRKTNRKTKRKVKRKGSRRH